MASTTTDPDDIRAPLRNATFRRIWVGSVVFNLGSFIQAVGLAWAMTEVASSAGQVALVQTASGLPFMLMSMLAGAIADVHDRRIVALVSLVLALTAAIATASLAWFGLLTPHLLLALCFVAGCGTALLSPAQQAAVTELVPAQAVPAAVALGSISFNVGRCIGPAMAGVIVATAGTTVALAVGALCIVPLLLAMVNWGHRLRSTRLPPEPLRRAVVSGIRYVAYSPTMKVLLIHCVLIGLIASSTMALLPLVAREILHGEARTYGFLASAFGVGAVVGALNLARLRRRISDDAAVRFSALLTGTAIATLALSRWPALSAVALFVAGAASIVSWAVFSISIRLAAPEWVAARSLAAYQTAAWGGVAMGSWFWGTLTNATGVEVALLVAASLMFLYPASNYWLRIPNVGAPDEQDSLLDDPHARMPLAGDDGPLIVEIEYRIAQENTQKFLGVMRGVQQFRERNGAYGWSLALDIADPELWTEHYQCPTWHDYLRQRNRPTRSERQLEQRAFDLHKEPGSARVRRMLKNALGNTSR